MSVLPRRSAACRPRGSAGFTLIELLICVVVIGILAAAAVPRFANTKGKANLSNVKSDLHNLIVAQEGYFTERQVYASTLAALDARVSSGVDVEIVEATGAGWSARAVHPGAVPVGCAVFYGAAVPLAPATVEGVVACR